MHSPTSACLLKNCIAQTKINAYAYKNWQQKLSLTYQNFSFGNGQTVNASHFSHTPRSMRMAGGDWAPRFYMRRFSRQKFTSLLDRKLSVITTVFVLSSLTTINYFSIKTSTMINIFIGNYSSNYTTSVDRVRKCGCRSLNSRKWQNIVGLSRRIACPRLSRTKISTKSS